MKNPSNTKKRLRLEVRIEKHFALHDINLFGLACLQDLSYIENSIGTLFPGAVSFAVPMNAEIMAGIKQGPHYKYANEYLRVNEKINLLSSTLITCIEEMGYAAKSLSPSEQTNPVEIKGDFPHKTAATRAGLGWIGRNCQLITKDHGPWIRLGTVFTDLPVKYNKPVNKSYCGECRICVEKCPANALLGNLWYPEIPREELLDARVCDHWKKEHYYRFNQGHNCGICAAVCPFGK